MLKNRVQPGGTGTTPLLLSQGDAADQYGFAFTIRRAAAPDLVDTTGAALPWAVPSTGALDATAYPPGVQTTPGVSAHVNFVDGLYEVQVMVYRNFEQFSKGSASAADNHELGRTHEPVGRFTGLIAIGG